MLEKIEPKQPEAGTKQPERKDLRPIEIADLTAGHEFSLHVNLDAKGDRSKKKEASNLVAERDATDKLLQEINRS